MKNGHILKFIGLWLICSLTVVAQSEPTNPVLPIAAYQTDGGLYVFNLEDTPILVSGTESDARPSIFNASPVWSPDGGYLAYQETEYSGDLYISSIDDPTLQEHVANLDHGSMLTFTMDSQNLIFSTFGEWEPAANPPGIENGTWLQSTPLLESYSIHDFTVHEIPASTFPIIHEIYFGQRDDIYFTCPSYGIKITESRETQFTPVILEDTPYGIVTAFNHPEQEDTSRVEIGATILDTPLITYATATSNNEQIVFKVGDQTQVGIINLPTEQIELYDLSYIPEAIVGDGEHYIYYAVRIESEVRIIPRDVVSPQIWYLSCDEYINEVAIYRFDTRTHEETLLYTSDNYAIPWMSLSPDGEDIYFTVIPNGEIWLEALLEDECMWQECEEYLFPDLYRLNTTTLQSDLILNDVLKPVINFGYQSQD